MDFTTVAKVGAIPEGQGQAFPINGRMVAVFNENGKYWAIDDFCPHMGASLAGGHVEDGIVACPWHLWRFCIKDGAWCDNPSISIDHFEVRVEGDEIQVAVPEKETKKSEKSESADDQPPEDDSDSGVDPSLDDNPDDGRDVDAE